MEILPINEVSFKKIFDTHTSPMLLIEPLTGLILDANYSAITFYGYTKSKLCSMSINDLNSTDSDKIFVIQQNDLNFEQNHSIFHHRLAGGDIRTVEIISNPVDIDDKRILFLIILAFHSDITENKIAEEALKEANQKLTLILESVGEGIFGLDIEGINTFINSSALKMLGYNSDELIGKHNHTIIHHSHPDGTYYPKEECLIYAVLESGKITQGEEYFWRKDGSGFFVEFNCTPIIEKGKITGAVITFKDITERKLSEEELLRSEIKYRTLYNSTTDAVMLIDSFGFFDCNNATLNIFHCSSKEEFCSLHPADVSPEKQPDGSDSFTLSNHYIDLAMENGSLRFDWIHKRQNTGELFPAEVLLSRMSLDEKPILQAVVRDITERKKVEHAIMESEERLKSLTQSTNDAIITIDINSIIVGWNKAAENIFGYSEKEMIGESLIKIIPEKFRVFHVDGLKRIKDGGEPIIIGRTVELLGLQKDGNIFPLELSLSEWETSKGKFYTSIIRDISERRKVEEEQKKLLEQLSESNEIIEINLFQKNSLIEELSETKEFLEKTIKEKDKFFSIIAHDLKSPFNGFLGLTKMMADNISDFSIDDLSEISKSMQQSAINLLSLLENLLEWANMQRGGITFYPQQCNISLVINENVDLISELANQKEINITTNIADEITVAADLQMLNTVVRNFLSNAIKFTPRGGNIEIGIKHKSSDNSNKSGRFCEIYVRDSGIGIDKNTIDKLFKIDQKVSRNGTEGEPSTGLGLLLSKEFTDILGGSIQVESEVGIGTQISLILPKSNYN